MTPATPPPLPELSAEDRLRLSHQAGDWYVRRQQPDWTGADERALNAWMDEDPRHGDAWGRVGRTWADAAQLRQGLAARASPGPGAGRRTRWHCSPAFASAALVLCLLAVLAGGYGWYRWDHTAGYVLDVATAGGETRVVDLPDGSRVALNVDSTLRVRYYPRRRETVLERGEAFFQVAVDAGRPFTVDSGPSQVEVLGTAFNVRAAPPELRIQVREGQVAVRTERARRDGQVLTMGPGAGVAIDAGTGRHRSVPAAPDTVAEWRSGQIHFDRTPLAEVAAELARYLGQPVTLGSAGLARLPVSGLLALRSPQSFLEALPSLIDVRVQRQDEGWRILPR